MSAPSFVSTPEAVAASGDSFGGSSEQAFGVVLTASKALSEQAPVLLAVENLSVGFERGDGSGRMARAVEEVSFTLRRGRTLCLVGESGCGKSVTALSIPRLLPSPPSRLLGGGIFFEGRDLTQVSGRELTGLRGGRIGMIFQDPMTSLNPVMRVGDQIAEGLCLHRGLGRAEAREAAAAMLDIVGIPSAAQRARDFPHQMSGGMRQRVMIGMALACGPSLLIADEPTTALDVTVQRQILALMRELIDETGSGLLLITHDLGVVTQAADDVAVMYAGRIVEQGPAREVLAHPAHPYTVGLLHSLPSAAQGAVGEENPRQARLGAIAGTVPDLWSRPSGCSFHPRCPHAFARCREEIPPFFALEQDAPVQGGACDSGGRFSRCWLQAAAGQ